MNVNVPPRIGRIHGLVLALAGLLALPWPGLLLPGSAAELPTASSAQTTPPKTKPTAENSTATASSQASWKSLFDGKSLSGWTSTDFAGRGEVFVTNGTLRLDSGLMTGITWTNLVDLPRTNYEISLQAMRVEGSDFFCGLTFPVGRAYCSFIVGGWGGGVVGLSSLDGQDASQNESTKYINFQNNRWYDVRVRVAAGKIEAWIDADKMADVELEGKSLSLRLEVEASKPLGIATWNTGAALRQIKLRRL